MTPIPTHDARVWAMAWLALTAASGTTLASHLHVRRLDARGVRMVPVHVAVLAGTVGCGLLLLGPGWLWRPGPGGPVRAVASLAAGLLLGAVVVWADGWISRTAARRPPVAPRIPSAGEGAAPNRLRPVGLGSTMTPLRSAAHTGADRRWTPTRRDTDLNLALGWLLATAVAEECVFRGVLLNLALLPDAPVARVAAVAAAVAAFALSHAFFGWHQVLAKLPLSLLATLATLVLGTILAAAVGHALFNWHVWRHRPVVTQPGTAR
ncbi:type II CAAX prenyl endopeptidase Rce1 family protein [Streptomyces puniciscabiei]|uniref:CPBP family glutamic-type intramembrane protease n=1 Tax=Streptomyces puniciscabiei TaxID=164348 RepID=UPI003787D41E